MLTLASLKDEIGDGIVFIFGGVTDAFGAAQEEMSIVLREIDALALLMHARDPNYLRRQSKIVEGLVYEYGGNFRQVCLRSCQMHNFERVLITLLDKLLGSQGLAHEMTTSQGMYRLNYYWVKFRNMLDTITVDALGGDTDLFKDAPKAVKNLIGEIARTRWVSAERTSKNLLDALNAPATEKLISMVSNYFGGKETEDWIQVSKYFTCVGTDDLSHIMLSFWWLANHSPGGKKGEGLTSCIQVVGFLGTPHHRVSMMFASALYPIHIQWTMFSDRTSEIGLAPHAISTRAIENAVFERTFTQQIYELCNDWTASLPDVHSFLVKEASRAVKLALTDKEEIMINYFDNLVKDGCKDMMKVVSKYFFLPSLRLGWSLLQVVDPFVGPHAAAAILCVLRKKGLINLDPSVTDEQLLAQKQVVEQANSQNKNESKSENENESESENKNEKNKKWSVCSESEAFPGVAMQEYENMIMDSFSNASEGVAASIVKAYGLSNPAIINELIFIARGKLLKILTTNNTTIKENSEKWSGGKAVKHYWPLFEKEFPSLHDTITVNFQTRPITGTTAEQTFSMASTQVRANNCATTNSKNMNHAQSVRGAILREMYDFEGSHNNTNKRKRQLKSSDSRKKYLTELDKTGNVLMESYRGVEGRKIPSVRKTFKRGKKLADLKSIYDYTKDEMQANEKKGNNMASYKAVIDSVKRSSYAKENNLDVIEVVKDKLVEKAKKMNIKELKEMLVQYFVHDPDECKLIKKSIKGDGEVSGSLVNRYVLYWKNKGETDTTGETDTAGETDFVVETDIVS